MRTDHFAEVKPVVVCPYCKDREIVKRGLRRKKLETIQLYYCQNCRRKFTPLLFKGKTYPLKIIFEALTLYNRLFTLQEAAKQVSEKYGLSISPQNLSRWIDECGPHLSFCRMRPFIEKKYRRYDIIAETKLFHGQIYNFKYHRAKTDLILNEEFRHYKFKPLQEFLELVLAECPHQVFKRSQKRASDYQDVFNLDKVRISPKDNTAVKNARLILQAVANNKLRHEILQEFMLVNDSVTVASEVPVLLDHDDLFHYKNMLGFEIPEKLLLVSVTDGQSSPNESVIITGHIDLLQIRNGAIHILDYKPSASKEKCVDQLTLYALALSRLTGLRLFHFKCAWFDEEDYFEFYPLHVVYKKKKRTVAKLKIP